MNPDPITALAVKILGTFLRHSQVNKSSWRRGLNLYTSDRFTNVLDSIVSICVSGVKFDVVAVALKLSLPAMRFVVAANDESR
jgi:hypothetical protein